MYYRGAAGAVIVYDVSDGDSLKNARGWYTQLKMLGEPGVQVRILGRGFVRSRGRSESCRKN